MNYKSLYVRNDILEKITVNITLSPIISEIKRLDTHLKFELNKFTSIKEVLAAYNIEESEIMIIVDNKVVSANFLLIVDGQDIFLGISLSGG
jgi:sulfur carrier protein ThiS